MIKLVTLPDVLDGTGAFTYTLPDSVPFARVVAINATFTSTAAGSIDVFFAISSPQGDIKAMAPAPNIGAGHASITYLTWGCTGAYYSSVQGAGDMLQIPLTDTFVQGGDIFTFTGVCGASEGWQNISLWLDME